MGDKTIFITGGNEGIGFATAFLFAEQGVNVAIMGRRASKNAEAVSHMASRGLDCCAIEGDVTRESDIERAIEITLKKYGSLNYAFNNAGITDFPRRFEDLGSDDFDALFNINVKGVALSMKHELPAILASGGGAIVNTGSIASSIGLNMLPFYAASKHALLGLTKSLALEYAPRGVRINMVCPGTVEGTGIYHDMTSRAPSLVDSLVEKVPFGRLASPSEVANCVRFLCSDMASYMTGQAVYVDGGFTAG